jgi:23S rRNA pseudoU1915 N3-methylase RlmH
MAFSKAIVLSEIEFRSLSLDLLEIIAEEEIKFDSWEELKDHIKQELELILDEYQADEFLVILNQRSYFMSEEKLAETIIEKYEESFEEFVEEEKEI